jgi:hypothetical protein
MFKFVKMKSHHRMYVRYSTILGRAERSHVGWIEFNPSNKNCSFKTIAETENDPDQFYEKLRLAFYIFSAYFKNVSLNWLEVEFEITVNNLPEINNYFKNDKLIINPDKKRITMPMAS